MLCQTCGNTVETPYCVVCGTRVNPVKTFDDINDGLEFELHCAEVLTLNGFINVQLTQGSFDYGVDILAEKDDITYAIQCKCYSSAVGNSAVQQAAAGRMHYKRDIAVVMTNNRFTDAAIKLADDTGVKLWDAARVAQFEYAALERQGGISLRNSDLAVDGGRDTEKEAEEILRALDVIMERGTAASALLSEEFGCDYNTARRIMEKLENMGFVSPRKPDRTRDILMTDQLWQSMKDKWKK